MDINNYTEIRKRIDGEKLFENRICSVTVQELSLVTGFKPRTIYNWIHREPDFPYVKWGKTVRFNPEKVFRWLAERS